MVNRSGWDRLWDKTVPPFVQNVSYREAECRLPVTLRWKMVVG